jgi:hypothetical protein
MNNRTPIFTIYPACSGARCPRAWWRGLPFQKRDRRATFLLRLAIVIVAGTSSACERSEELNRARAQANEATAIANIRIMLSAQAAYSAGNDGAYGSIECLQSPKACVHTDPGQPYLEKDFVLGERAGYIYHFDAGGNTPQAVGRPPGSTLSTFAIVATPAVAGSSGTRRFCGDSRMYVCTLLGDSVVSGAQCPSSCQPVQ